MPDPRQTLGQRGETFVAGCLRRAGYTILARNWRTASGEIDIIARQPGAPPTVVFVEVRARRGPLRTAIEAALESVDARKQARLSVLAEEYLGAHQLDDIAWRIDVAAVAYDNGRFALEVIHHAADW
jgi:putative endonuclease